MALSIEYLMRRRRNKLTYPVKTGGHESVQLIVADMLVQ